ncbi:MAG: ABC transporter substrate-binding protein [Candidatus Lustribacter sp.]|jgi:branched-chain amino acid transport system substrate-binding protein
MADRTVSRKTVLKTAAAATAGFGIPAFLPRIGEAAADLPIGLVEPTTGIYATYGEYERAGIAMAVADWNARGGVMGRKVVTFSEDDENDPGVGVQKARKLVQQDHCVALIGTINSGISLSVSGAANSLGVMFMDSGGHTDDVTGKNCNWNTFRVCHSTWMETHATGYDLAQRFGKKWYIITPDYAFGHSLYDGYVDVAKQIGVDIIANDLVPLTLTDFSPYLTKVQSAKPSLLIVLNQGDQFVNALKQAAAFGIQKTIPIGGPQVELEAVEALPPEARVGFWGVEWYYDSPLSVGAAGSAGRRFVAAYKKKYNKTPSARSAFGYIAMDRVLWSMAEAKSTDAVKTCKALENARFNSIFEGTSYFRKEDHQMMWPMLIGEIQPNGTASDKDNLFKIIGAQPADKVEQTIAEKAKVCTITYPS